MMWKLLILKFNIIDTTPKYKRNNFFTHHIRYKHFQEIVLLVWPSRFIQVLKLGLDFYKYFLIFFFSFVALDKKYILTFSIVSFTKYWFRVAVMNVRKIIRHILSAYNSLHFSAQERRNVSHWSGDLLGINSARPEPLLR